MSADWTVRSLFHVNINCTNIARSLEFYEALGFRRLLSRESEEEVESGGNHAAVGISGPVSTRGPYLLALGDDPLHATRLDLLEWVTPPSAPHEAPEPNQVGIPRIALWTKNIDSMYEDLEARGVTFVTPPVGPFPAWKIHRMVSALDPDGLMVEFLEFMPRAQELYTS